MRVVEIRCDAGCDLFGGDRLWLERSSRRSMRQGSARQAMARIAAGFQSHAFGFCVRFQFEKQLVLEPENLTSKAYR